MNPPRLMGIVNATPDSFSDPQVPKDLSGLVERAREQLAAGAALIDVGGESGRTDTEAVPVEEEIVRVVPLVERLSGEGVTVSVDTWRAPVARAALDAGAAMINDVSGLSDPKVADACATAGAALVITHTRVPPKTKGFPAYADVVEDVRTFLQERAEEARARGVTDEQLVFDPGIDLAKTPAESVEVLRRLPEVSELGRPPSDRRAGTLAAVGAAVDGGAAILRVHDVADARDYLAVRAALRGETAVGEELRLDPGLRRERV